MSSFIQDTGEHSIGHSIGRLMAVEKTILI